MKRLFVIALVLMLCLTFPAMEVSAFGSVPAEEHLTVESVLTMVSDCDSGMIGEDWAADAVSNQMLQMGEKIWQITYPNVPGEENYQVMVARCFELGGEQNGSQITTDVAELEPVAPVKTENTGDSIITLNFVAGMMMLTATVVLVIGRKKLFRRK